MRDDRGSDSAPRSEPAAGSDLEADLALALALADEARAISLSMFRGPFGQRLKPDGSVVTDADEAVERAIRARLASERPGDAMLGEEYGETGSGRRRWIVDAIDGTHSFASGSDEWGTLIALEIDGRVMVGVCDQAPVDRRYWAARGCGAYRSAAGGPAARLGVSTTATLERARCFVPDERWLPAPNRSQAAALIDATQSSPPSGDHPALEVASGDLELAVFFMGGPWDVAAPAIVVEEAGGRFSDRRGGSSIALGGGVFSNGHLHDAAIGITSRG